MNEINDYVQDLIKDYKRNLKIENEEFVEIVSRVLMNLLHDHESDLRLSGSDMFWIPSVYKIKETEEVFTFNHSTCRILQQVALNNNVKIEVLYNTDIATRLRMSLIVR